MDAAVRRVDPRSLGRELPALYRRAYQGLEAYAYRGEEEVRNYLRWLRRRSGGSFLVAFVDERPAGFIAVDPSWHDLASGETIGEIHEVVVDPAFQGRGIGLKLCQAGLEALQAAGRHRVGLWVGERNARAQALYRQLGFRPAGRWGKWLRMLKEAAPPQR